MNARKFFSLVFPVLMLGIATAVAVNHERWFGSLSSHSAATETRAPQLAIADQRFDLISIEDQMRASSSIGGHALDAILDVPTPTAGRPRLQANWYWQPPLLLRL